MDGFSVFATVIIAAAVILGALLLDGWLRREGMEGSEPYVLMLLSAVRRRDDGVGQRPDRDVPRPRDPLDRGVRAGRHAPAEDHLAGSRREVLRARGLQLGLLPLRHRPHLRRHRVHQPRRHRRASSPPPSLADSGLVLAGLALLLVGFAFKVAAVPFHFWTPDVYQGAPSPSVAWMASGVKVAGFAGLLRVFYLAFGTYRRRLAADRVRPRRPHDDRRLGARRRADRREAHARLQLDQPRRLRPRGRAGRRASRASRRPSSTWPPTRSWSPAASASSP